MTKNMRPTEQPVSLWGSNLNPSSKAKADFLLEVRASLRYNPKRFWSFQPNIFTVRLETKILLTLLVYLITMTILIAFVLLYFLPQKSMMF